MSKSTLIRAVADFETTTDLNDCRVWLWGYVTLDNVFTYGTDISSFIDHVSSVKQTCYFHNLKFDGSFILDYLLNNGYEHTDARSPKRGQFTTIIDSMGKFYQIDVCFDNGTRVKFLDSLKKLPMTVRQIAETYQLEEGKGDIDYKSHRPIGYSPTDAEVDYVRRDVSIVAQALSLMFEEKMTSLTISSDSLREFKRLVGKQFEPVFPTLDFHTDTSIRKAYRGGWAYAKEDKRYQIVGPGSTYDVNSLYPSVMYNELMPRGEPRYTSNEEVLGGYPLRVTGRSVVGRLRPGFLPCIQIKGSSHFLNVEYVKEIKEPTILYGTNIDWQLWNKHYDLEYIKELGTYHFKGSHGLFDKYIDKWMEVKANSTGGMRHISKLHLNSLYGKFGSNPSVQGKVPYLGNDGIVKFRNTDPEERKPIYLPVAIFTTAYARRMTITAAQDNYDRFLYADTDSLHLLGVDQPHGVDVDPHELGKWKHEYNFDEGLFIRAKQYGERVGDEYVVHIAGAPRSITDTMRLADMVDGAVFHGKLVPVRTRGGVVLTDTTFTLKY